MDSVFVKIYDDARIDSWAYIADVASSNGESLTSMDSRTPVRVMASRIRILIGDRLRDNIVIFMEEKLKNRSRII